MPVTGVYQILPGFFTCLPRGCGPSSDGSQTRTATSCWLPFFNAVVISKKKGSYPPWCVPTFFPFTNTSHNQSTAPKCSKVFLFLLFVTATVFLYHSTLSLPTVFATPDSADSTANGTKILPVKPEGIVTCSFGRIAYCHTPFKFVQLLERTICGRGYSGKGLEAL